MPMNDAPIVAKRKRKSEFAGAGCLIQGLGLLAPVLLGAALGAAGVVIGIAILVVLFFVGSSKASKWVCGNCRNPLASKDVRVCAACRAQIE